MYTIFACLGGTGTQIGRTIGTLYPLLQQGKIIDRPFSMFILDKDTVGIYSECTGAHDRYDRYRKLLPFESFDSYPLNHTIYQELQEETGLLRNKDYTVMDLVGGDTAMKELASMCWTQDKREESIRDGNNRDPSRGSIDVDVCLKHLEKSSLFRGKDGKKGIEDLIHEQGANNVRVVILGGATGGMGSSLIVPLARELRARPGCDKLRIDLVILGTYFAIPQRKTDGPAVDNIGTTLDSFYRAADQIQELADLAENDWRVYYAAIPGFDEICGEFKKNGPPPRKSHLLELSAALAAFALEKDGESKDVSSGFYETVLAYEEAVDKPVEWNELPLGALIQKPALRFLELVSVLACRILPNLSGGKSSVKGSDFFKNYGKEIQDQEIAEKMREFLKAWLDDVKPFFNFWDEIQEYSYLGRKDSKRIVNFFDPAAMKQLREILSGQTPEEDLQNKIPLWPETWLNFAQEMNADKKRVKEAAASQNVAQALVQAMIADIYEYLSNEKRKANQ